MSSKSSQESPSKSIQVSAAKAAFIGVKGSISQDLDSREEFEWALQNAGYNPTPEFMNRYWTPNTQGICFREFDHILQMEPLPRKLDLLSYFRMFDPENEGLIAHEQFLVAMTTRGKRLSTASLASILDNPNWNRDGSLDYKAFVADVFETSAKLAEVLKNNAITEEQNLIVNSNTYKVKRKASSPSHKITWNSQGKVKGAFYFEGENIIGHQYNLVVEKDGLHEVLIHPNCKRNVDCQVFIFKVTDENVQGSPENKYKYIGCSPLVIVKGFISGETIEARQSWMGELSKGSYLIVPFTTGCKLKKRQSQPSSNVALVEPTTKGKLKLTSEFKAVLSEIYHQVDLDGNGTLSRTEFNLFNWRTSGEEVQDEEWQVVVENFDMKDGELTLEGFLQLHQMEAEDNGGDSAELWITLNAMGYNVGLVQDESAIFEITIKSEHKAKMQLQVSGLKSGGSILDKAVIRNISESCPKPKKIDRSEDIFLFRQDSKFCSSFVIQNRSNHAIKMQMDFSQSRNVLINHPHLNFRASLSAKSTLIAAHLLPKDAHADFQVILQEAILK